MSALDQELSTVRDFIRYAVTAFGHAGLSYGHGTHGPYDDAVFLLAETLKLPYDDMPQFLDARLLSSEKAKLAEIFTLRIQTRKPSAYLLNKAYMHGRPFYVDENVIVPRSHIGEILLQDGGVDFTIDPADVTRVLDLCTGSGCLAILAAETFPHAMIDAVDISPGALAVAARNVESYNLQDRIRLIESDLFAALEGEVYDIIISNPPYVTAASVHAFPAEHKNEPVMAHLGGADGMDLVRNIIANAGAHLTDAGGLLCEVGVGMPVLADTMPDAPFLWLDTSNAEAEVFWLDASFLKSH